MVSAGGGAVSVGAIVILSMTAAMLAVFLCAVYQNVTQGQRRNAEAIFELKERVSELEDELFRRDMVPPEVVQ